LGTAGGGAARKKAKEAPVSQARHTNPKTATQNDCVKSHSAATGSGGSEGMGYRRSLRPIGVLKMPRKRQDDLRISYPGQSAKTAGRSGWGRPKQLTKRGLLGQETDWWPGKTAEQKIADCGRKKLLEQLQQKKGGRKGGAIKGREHQIRPERGNGPMEQVTKLGSSLATQKNQGGKEDQGAALNRTGGRVVTRRWTEKKEKHGMDGGLEGQGWWQE